jgi:hypothetical protein
MAVNYIAAEGGDTFAGSLDIPGVSAISLAATEASDTFSGTVTGADAPSVPSGGRARPIRERLRPEMLDPAQFDLYFLEVGQEWFAITFVAGNTVELASLQAPQFGYEFAWSALAEVAVAFEQDGPTFALASTVPPLRKDVAPVMPRVAVARVRLAMEQEPGEVEFEVA